MTGLELVMGGLLHLASIGGCTKPAVPAISAAPSIHVTRYDFTKGRDELQHFEIDTVSPYGPGHQSKIGGLMSGELRVESRIRFMQEKHPARGAGCMHIDKIEIVVHVNPTIYVAREYAKGTCQHNAIIEHEKKHVSKDREIAYQHAEALKKDVRAYLQRAGHSNGPHPLERLATAQERMQSEIQNVIQQTNNRMTQDRRAEQQKLDSLEEYNRVAAQCRGGLKLPETVGSNPPRPSVTTPRHSRYNQ